MKLITFESITNFDLPDAISKFETKARLGLVVIQMLKLYSWQKKGRK